MPAISPKQASVAGNDSPSGDGDPAVDDGEDSEPRAGREARLNLRQFEFCHALAFPDNRQVLLFWPQSVAFFASV